MASTGSPVADLANDIDTDYGSDFSPEEEQIVERLLAGKNALEDDNPNTTEIEYHDARETLKLPRVFGREQRSALFQALRAAETAAEQIAGTVAVQGGEHADRCELAVLIADRESD